MSDLAADLEEGARLLMELAGIYRHQHLSNEWEKAMNASNRLSQHAARIRAERGDAAIVDITECLTRAAIIESEKK